MALTGTLVRLDKKVRPPARVVSNFRMGGPLYRLSKVPKSAKWLSLLWKTSDDMFFIKGSLSSTYPMNCRRSDRAKLFWQQGGFNLPDWKPKIHARYTQEGQEHMQGDQSHI